jgi:hypothetical protein
VEICLVEYRPRRPFHDPAESSEKFSEPANPFKGTLLKDCLQIKTILSKVPRIRLLALSFFLFRGASDPGEQLSISKFLREFENPNSKKIKV